MVGAGCLTTEMRQKCQATPSLSQLVHEDPVDQPHNRLHLRDPVKLMKESHRYLETGGAGYTKCRRPCPLIAVLGDNR